MSKSKTAATAARKALRLLWHGSEVTIPLDVTWQGSGDELRNLLNTGFGAGTEAERLTAAAKRLAGEVVELTDSPTPAAAGEGPDDGP